MFTAYVLYSATTQKHYKGFTGKDVNERLAQHNTPGNKHYTKSGQPWVVVFTKEFDTKEEAMWYERWLKSGEGWKMIKSLPHYEQVRKGEHRESMESMASVLCEISTEKAELEEQIQIVKPRLAARMREDGLDELEWGDRIIVRTGDSVAVCKTKSGADYVKRQYQKKVNGGA